jgi:hypothetical protein
MAILIGPTALASQASLSSFFRGYEKGVAKIAQNLADEDFCIFGLWPY